MVMTSESMLASLARDEDVEALQNEIDPSQRDWPVAEADCFVERLDLGPGISTFFGAGSPIPPALATLPRHEAAPSPETPEGRTPRATRARKSEASV